MGYDVIRRDRTVNGRFGGGVCFYIRSNINYVVREDLNNELLEILSIEILKPNSKPFVVTSWYRPPNSLIDLFSNIDSLLARIDSENVEHYLMGDMNCGLLSSENIYARALLNVTDIYGLKQLIDEPTRVTPSTSTLIDLIFTSHQDNILCSGVTHVGISDHSLVYAYRKISIPPVSKGITSSAIDNLNTSTAIIFVMMFRRNRGTISKNCTTPMTCGKNGKNYS